MGEDLWMERDSTCYSVMGAQGLRALGKDGWEEEEDWLWGSQRWGVCFCFLGRGQSMSNT